MRAPTLVAAQEALDQPQEEGPALVSPALDCVAVSLLLLARMLCVYVIVYMHFLCLLLCALTAVAVVASDVFSCFPDSTYMSLFAGHYARNLINLLWIMLIID